MSSPAPEGSPPSSPSSPPPSPDTSSPPPSSSSPPPSSPPPTSPPPASPPPSSPPPSSTPPPTESSPPPPLPSDQNSNPPTPPKDTNSSPPPPPPTSSSNSPPSPPPPKNDNAGNSWSPPPPPSKSHQPPTPPRSLGPSKSSSTSSSDNGGGTNNLVPVVVGVVVVGVLLLLAMLLCLCMCRKKKKRSPHYDYYNDSKPSGGDYYKATPPQYPPTSNWHNESRMTEQQVGNLPPPPGGGHGAWSQQPPPPPPTQMPTISSSEMSSNFSGGPVLPPPHPSLALGFTKSSFTYDELAAATGGFTQANLLGQGGFGYVHKGVLPNGKEIAVKSLKAGSGQGDREFQAEVEIISRVHHRHLVSLVGYSIAGGQKLLVYEFVPNSTLEFHLHGKGRPTMDWPTRLKIALGSAKGLAYLHEDCHPRIIHRDIKAANILLDFNYEAKVADFGLAKLTTDNYTHVSTRVMGTFGYLAPEYASSGKLTEKSDVFSFGVMLLELITGRRPVDPSADMEDSLVDWARPLCAQVLEDNYYNTLVDPALEGNYNVHEMACMIACAGASVSHSARRRPKMSQIVRALEGEVSLDEGIKPGRGFVFSSTSGSSDYDTSSYSTDMRRFRKTAFDSTEYASSDFGHTSEYGLNPSSSSSEEMSKSRNGSRRQIP